MRRAPSARLGAAVRRVRAAAGRPVAPAAPDGAGRQPPWVRGGLYADPGFRWDLPAELTARPADLVEMGDHSYNVPRVEWYAGDTGRVRIGRYCSIHATVTLMPGGEHRFDWVTAYALRPRFGLPGALRDGQPWSRGDVVVGNDVYLGVEAMVLSGVTIGDGAVVAARSVVTRDVAPYSVVAGSPARHVRWRFDEPTREALQRIRWWDWPDERVVAEVGALNGPDVAAFVARHDPGPVAP